MTKVQKKLPSNIYTILRYCLVVVHFDIWILQFNLDGKHLFSYKNRKINIILVKRNFNLRFEYLM